MSLLHFPEKTFTSNPRQMASRWWKVAPGNMLQTLSLIPKIYPTSYVTCSSDQARWKGLLLCMWSSTVYQGLISSSRKLQKRSLESKTSLALRLPNGGSRSSIWIVKRLEDGNVVLLPQVSRIWYSELASTMPVRERRQWFAVNGSVYDVSSFYETHQGKRIVSMLRA